MEAAHFSFGKFVKILWEDSAYIGGWICPPGFEVDPGRITSVGQVVATDEKGIAITTSINDQGSCITPLSIPWGAIEKIEEI